MGERKGEGAHSAERVLSEATITNLVTTSSQRGVIQERAREYRWQLHDQPWEKDSMRLVSVRVTFDVQGQDYDVLLSTLVDSSSGTASSVSSTTSSTTP